MRERELRHSRFLAEHEARVSMQRARTNKGNIHRGHENNDHQLPGEPEGERCFHHPPPLVVPARAIDEEVGLLRPLLPLTIGSEHYAALKAHVARAFLAEFPSCVPATYAHREEASNLASKL